MSLGIKPAADSSGAGQQPKPSSHGSARFERLLSGLSGAGPLVDIEPDRVKDEIRRWAKKVASSLVRQLSFGTWPERSLEPNSGASAS
jgi:hypothetical protein